MPALLSLHDPEALAARPVEIVGSIAGGAEPNLHAALAVEQALLYGDAERRAMGELLAEHGLVDVGMGVDMHEADWAVFLLEGAQDRDVDGVIAAHGERLDVVR